MEYTVDSNKRTELLQIKCEECEDCYANEDPYSSYEEYQLALKSCETCEDCKKHGNCQTVLWQGPVGSLFADFISLDFNDLNSKILEIVNKYFPGYNVPKELFENYKWGYELANEIDQFLITQHFMFNYCSIGDTILANLNYFNHRGEFYESSKEVQDYLVTIGKIVAIDVDSFPDLINKVNFWEYKCLQSILDECIKNQNFYNMISSKNSPLEYFGFGLTPLSKTSELIDLKFHSMFAKSVSPNNIVEMINIASQQKLYMEPDINEYDISDTSDFILSSFAFVLDMGLSFRKCENCKKYFIPENKSDTKYCSRTSPQYPHLTCKEAARYIKQLKREKGNKTEMLRKSIYNTLRNRLYSKKALNDEVIYQKDKTELSNFLEQAAQWKSDIESGLKSEQQYVKWLSSFKKRGPKHGDDSETGK